MTRRRKPKEPPSDEFRARVEARAAYRCEFGRATIAALDLNAAQRFRARRLWFKTGWLP